jgi:hypothetical protein
MLEQPALGDSQFETGTVFGRAATSPQEGQVDLLDMKSAVLHGFDGIADLDQLSGNRSAAWALF